MNKCLKEDELQHVLANGLAEIARFARYGYETYGRGTVAILHDGESISGAATRYTLRYLRYKDNSPVQGSQTGRIIAAYDPCSELVVQYIRACGRPRTIHLRAPPVAATRVQPVGVRRLKGWLSTMLSFPI